MSDLFPVSNFRVSAVNVFLAYLQQFRFKQDVK